MRKVNGKLISKLNVFAIIIAMCLAILFSGFTALNQAHADEKSQDVEVTNLEAGLGETSAPDKSFISFNLKINHKVTNGETLTLDIGYDKVDGKDKKINFISFRESFVKTATGDVVGTIVADDSYIKLTFNKKATKYDQLNLDVKCTDIFDVDSMSKNSNNITLNLPIYMRIQNSDGTYSKVKNSDGIFKRDIKPVGSFIANTNVYSHVKHINMQVNIGDSVNNSFHDGQFEVAIPEGLEVESIKGSCISIDTLKKPNGQEIYTFKFYDKFNAISHVKTDDNKIIFEFKKDKLKDYKIERIYIDLNYKDGYAYKENPYRDIKTDLTGIGGKTYTTPIKNGEVFAGGTGTILDVSKYQPEASPITVHKGDELSNKMITDHVIIKDKDGKTVKAEDINASKTRVDNNKIDTNTAGDYSATVNVEYKDGSTENVTVPIKVIDNVIPNLPDENGKNPEKPDGYVTVTMNAGQHGMLAKGEAKEYFVNPEKVVTIPAKDAIGKLGYKFSKWDSPLKAQFKNDKTINAKYKQLPDVIPNVPGHDGKKPEKPDGYVTVVVDPGNNGKLDPRDAGEYFVNPTKEVTIPIHNAVPNDGYKFNKWSPSKTGHFDHDMTIKAKYLAKGNANKPQTGDNGIEIPLAILISTIGMAFVAVKTKKHI